MTYYLLRHAEKQLNHGADPPLNQHGLARSERVVRLFSLQQIDAIWATPLLRTRQTVELLAISKGLEVREYPPHDLAKITDFSKRLAPDSHIVICGHQNTVPAMANQLIGKHLFEEFADNDYDRIFIIQKTDESTSWSFLKLD